MAEQKPKPPQNPPPPDPHINQDKSHDSHNLRNPHGYQSNGFKKHRDSDPI